MGDRLQGPGGSRRSNKAGGAGELRTPFLALRSLLKGGGRPSVTSERWSCTHVTLLGLEVKVST